MPLAFSFPAIVIKKERLIKQLESYEQQKHIVDFAKHLLTSNLKDDRLLGIESMSNSFDIELNLLSEMGMRWNDGTNAIDFYITNQGNYIANWLSYARIAESGGNSKIHYAAYKNALDSDDTIYSFDGCLVSKFPKNGIELSRMNWGRIAREEGNKLHQPTKDDFVKEVTKNNRVCPNPNLWNDLHTLAIESDFNSHTPPSLPLILGAWWDTSDLDKSERLKELIDWCYVANVSDVAWTFIQSLDESEWHHKS